MSLSLRQSCFLVFVAVLVTALGCDNRPDVIPVSGKVTVDGGPPPGDGTIYFTCESGRPGVAHYTKDGVFVASSLPGRNGLMPGTYKLAIECWKIPPTIDGPAPVSFAHPRFESATTSGIELVVDYEGDFSDLHYDISSR